MNISAVIIFHGEQFLAVPAILSLVQCCEAAKERDISIERIAILDRADPVTRSVVETHGHLFDSIEMVDYGDLGLSRNHGRDKARGKFIAFFDGDDLWGSEWIWRAYELIHQLNIPESILHPEAIYYFSADDYLIQSATEFPPRGSKSFFLVQEDSFGRDFDARVLFFNNIWTANSFAAKATYEAFPYSSINREDGFGVEDWMWNAETVARGVRHAVVPDTVHCIRLKSSGSLGVQNAQQKLLPAIYRFSDSLDKA